ncbi:MAG TPA: 4'-phosphopantetheinyl transferase superfamily protein [Puia sp.]|jgi:phosphopantetheinyl transferase (holo-ACP synthase)|nr:4'-phosphopantetheinyl transferase superfamily protein [Puia sp.]
MSTGNDIVALAVTDPARTSRYRFYSRIVSRSELEGLGSALPFPTFIWLLWSVKESAYKYISRSNPRLVFAPLKIPVSSLELREDYYEGMIQLEHIVLYSRSYVTSETIMTVVSDEKEFTNTRWGSHVIGDADYANQSASVREHALESLSTVAPGLRIVKAPDGPPEVWDGGRILDIPISLAHHERYVAWSYRLTANSSSYRKSAAN